MATGRWEILHMHRIFRKDQVLTIPNLLSVIRLALIPLIVWLYIGKQEYSAAVAVILISGATDIIDGFIARKNSIWCQTSERFWIPWQTS